MHVLTGALIMWIDTFRMHIGMLRHNHISNTVSLEWEPGSSQSLSQAVSITLNVLYQQEIQRGS